MMEQHTVLIFVFLNVGFYRRTQQQKKRTNECVTSAVITTWNVLTSLLVSNVDTLNRCEFFASPLLCDADRRCHDLCTQYTDLCSNLSDSNSATLR